MRRRPFVLVLGLYLATTGLWLLVTPPFEAPDEPSHYDFVRFIALTKSLPDARPEIRDGWYYDEWIQPPLYYIVLSPILSALGAERARPTLNANPSSWLNGGPDHVMYAQPDVRTTFTLAVFLLRGVSVLFGLVTVALIYRLVAGPNGNTRAATAACCGLLLVPGFGAFWATINNDTLATLLATAAMYLILGGSKWPDTVARAATIGLLCGAALSTKLSTACLGPAMLAALLVAWWRQPTQFIRRGAAFAAGVAATGGWVFIRNVIEFGEPMATTFKLGLLAPRHVPAVRYLTDSYFYTTFPEGLHNTLWASFGWTSVGPYPTAWVWSLYRPLSAVLIIVVLLCAWRAIVGLVRANERRAVLVACCAVAAEIAALTYYNLTWTAMQARYLYPVLAPALLLTTWGARDLAARLGAVTSPIAPRLVAGTLLGAMSVAWLATFRDALLGFYFGY